MRRELIHLYGPFSIHSFGLMIALGLIVFLWLAQQHPLRKKYMSAETFVQALCVGIFTGIAGGRMLYVINEWHTFESFWEIFALWEGGLSIMGCILAILMVMPLYLHIKKIPVMPLLDLAALHAPLLQGISRLGCFLAGCCYGTMTDVPWGITYTDPQSLAPLCLKLHPSQLYSSAILVLIFLFLYFVAQHIFKKQGQLVCLYLMLVSSERLVVDFARGDRTFFAQGTFFGIDRMLLSVHQWIALSVIIAATCAFVVTLFFGKQYNESV